MHLVNGYHVLHSTNILLSGSINGDVNGETVIWINNRGLFRMAKSKDAIFDNCTQLILTVLFSWSMQKLRLFHSWFMNMVTVIAIGGTDSLTNFTFLFIGVSACLYNCMKCFSFFLSSDIAKFFCYEFFIDSRISACSSQIFRFNDIARSVFLFNGTFKTSLPF